MNRSLILLALLALLVAACAPAAGPEPTGADPTDAPGVAPDARPPAALLARDAYPAYTSTFVIDYDGPARWRYEVRTRKSPLLEESNLHIEGVSGSRNPGDIRMVTDGTTTWMTGPGTDNECIQFPNNTGMDPVFIYPETLVPLDQLPGLTRLVREEQYAGKTSQYYAGGPTTVGPWQDVRLEYRQEKDGAALLQFAMLASGEDPAFGFGPGTLMATYTVDSLEKPAIEPVAGCEISLPLPASAKRFVRLPGMASFESAEDGAQIAAFYQSSLPAGGWSEQEPPAQVDGSTVLSYQRGAEQVEIHIEAATQGNLVRLIFLE